MSKKSNFARRALASAALATMGIAVSANAHPDSLVLTPPSGLEQLECVP